MAGEEIYHSYLIRVWQEDLKNRIPKTSKWQVEVRHIQSGQSWHMDDQQQLLDFLENLLGKMFP